jgi:hypothetical protein
MKIAVPLEWKRNETKLLLNAGDGNGNFEGDTEISTRKIFPSCGANGGQKCFMGSSSGKVLIFSNFIGLCGISVLKEF